MKLRVLLSALFKLRNIGILAAAMIVAPLLSDPTAFPTLFGYGYALPGSLAVTAGFAVYIGFVLQTLMSKQFHEESTGRKRFAISAMNRQANRLSSEAKKNTTHI